MGKGIYTYYKERLVEIGGNNKCLYLKSVVRKGAYDIGRIFEGRDGKFEEMVDFLMSSKSPSLTLISPDETREIVQNVGLPSRSRVAPDTANMTFEEMERANAKHEKNIAKDSDKALETEVSKVKDLQREIEEVERETGRYELYVGYPFVFGTITQGPKKMLIKAPLMLFPVKIEIIDEKTVELRRNEAEKTLLNRALIFAYAQSKKLDVEGLEFEFDDMSSFKSVKQVVEYLGKHKIKIECTGSKHVYNFGRFKEPDTKTNLSVRYAAVLARFPISNSIYNDYTLLEKKHLTNDAINELLRQGGKRGEKRIRALEKARAKELAKRLKRAKRGMTTHTYTVKMLDFAQSEVVRKVDSSGNVVIWGPPGTGKSQTIVNIITDALCKKKRVLVVSQKKAALDVVYSRLGTLNEKAMYVTDEAKAKKAFYERCLAAHLRCENESTPDCAALEAEYSEVQQKIDGDTAQLEAIYETMNGKREFGLSLLDMYSSSYMPAKNTSEYAIYLKMLESEEILGLNYKEMSEALFAIKAKDLGKTYYDFLVSKEKNPLIDTMKPDLDIRTLSEVKGSLDELHRSRKSIFNLAKYPYLRQALAYYPMLGSRKNLRSLVKLQAKLERPSALLRGRSERAMEEKFIESLEVIESFVKDYECIERVMTRDGFMSVIDNVIRGNTAYLRLVYDAIENYIATRDVAKLIDSIDKNMLLILEFAYATGKNYAGFSDIIDKILMLRIYHEIVKLEEECKLELSKTLDYQNIASRIYKQKEAQLTLANRICQSRGNDEYKALFASDDDSKNYLYQIKKDKKFWPIRKTMEVYGRFVLAQVPCWLLSPENVSSLLPLEKNLFDIVIFDEASQVFIESTIPTIYRGKNIVVAGDSKQLRPSATFMKRYMGADPEAQEDYSVQAALEVESLLDLAMARYESANLTYHYRSRHQELIDFSNAAFYSGGLQICPNTSANTDLPPIVRYKVDGRWVNRTNPTEAAKIVELLKEIFATRKNNESVGIITFNSDQQSCIADAIDDEAKVNADFRAAITKERYRLEGGEDTGLFIKNLENVQGDERDIIIFSIGYAPNELGRVYANFGSLSSEGGENRLNVAITRAKSKIIVVTSIEPEDLKVEDTKNAGPKLLKEYLTYVRAVSDGDCEHAKAILRGLCPTEAASVGIDTGMQAVELQIKERLERAGYIVHERLGNRNSRISLAIYDKESDRYLVGVELDKDAFAGSCSTLERDVYKPKFLESHGWSIVRVWCRDWWLYPSKVIRTVTQIAEKNKKR